MKLPGFKFRIAFAVSVIAASAAWLMRPLDRSVLIPMPAPPGKVEYINLQGRVVQEPRTLENAARWDSAIGSESPGLNNEAPPWHVSIPRIRGYADADGQLKYRIAWERLPPEIELVPVRKAQLWGYMNRANQWVVEPKYKVADVSRLNGIGVVTHGGGLGAINRSGQLVVPCEYDTIICSSDRRAKYVKATARDRNEFEWINRVKSSINGWLGTQLPIHSGEMSIYDCEGNVIYRSSWLFRSWASVWILLASAWIGLESVIWLIRRRHHKRPEAPPPSELPDLSSAARTH